MSLVKEDINYFFSEEFEVMVDKIKKVSDPIYLLLTSKKGGKAYVKMSEEEKIEKDVKNFTPFVDAFKKWIESNKYERG